MSSEWYLNPFSFSHASDTSLWSSVLAVKKQIWCPSSYQRLIVSIASGYASAVAILSGSSFGMSSPTVPSMSIR